MEVVVVVLLIGILSAVIAPKFTGHLDERYVDAAARLIQADVNWARQQAIATSQPVSIVLNPTAETYQISRIPPHRHASGGLITLSDPPWNSLIGDVKHTDAGAKLGTVTLTINGAGVLDNNLIIQLISRTASREVRVDAASGEVSVN